MRSARSGPSPSAVPAARAARRGRRPGALTRQSRVEGSSSTSASHTLDLVDFCSADREGHRRRRQPGRPLCGGRLVSAEFDAGERCAGSGLWCFTAHGAVDRIEIIGVTRPHHVSRPSTIGRSCSRRRAGGDVDDPAPAARAAAAHPDHRRRAAWQRHVSEHRRNRRPHVTGDGPAASLDYEAQAPGLRNQAPGIRD